MNHQYPLALCLSALVSLAEVHFIIRAFFQPVLNVLPFLPNVLQFLHGTIFIGFCTSRADLCSDWFTAAAGPEEQNLGAQVIVTVYADIKYFHGSLVSKYVVCE